MSETNKSSTPKAIYKPGELDSTRKNLGEMSPEEARRMAALLGGEIGVEKTPEFAPIKHAGYDKKARPYTAPKKKSSSSSSSSDSEQNDKKRGHFGGKASSEKERPSNLPIIPKKEQTAFDKLMASSEHRIKKSQNIFTILFSMGKTPDRVSSDFVSIRLLNHIVRMDKFFIAINKFVNVAESDFKLKVQTYETDKYKFFRFASNFNMTKIKNMQKTLAEHPDNVTVSDMVPITKEIYRPLMKIFYLGEEKIVMFIKEAAKEIAGDRKSVHIKFAPLVREACSEWIYIYNQVIKGLYPLLMRMCSTMVLPFARFFNKNGSKILDFLGMTKFDLILPDPDSKGAEKKEKERLQEESKKAEEKQDEDVGELDEDSDGENVIPKAIQQSLKTLENIFPDAGWENIGNGMDTFPYFQPLYKFSDGYNLLSEKNPMQVTICLLRILEDFFQGLRNVHFQDEKTDEKKGSDSISDIFGDWSAYQEIVFDRDYLPPIKEIVNHVSTQPDFVNTPYARKQIASILWETRTMFLPYLNYDYFFMEKEIRNSPYRPLPRRVEYLKEKWEVVLHQADEEKRACAIAQRPFSPEAVGVDNIMKPYVFAMENVVSKRLSALIGIKNRSNLTLLKYTYSVLLVLHWWISDPKSPAYKMNTTIPYRTGSDGGLLFSVATRTDLNAVFMRSIKMKQAERQASVSGTSPSPASGSNAKSNSASASASNASLEPATNSSEAKNASDGLEAVSD